MTVVRRFAVASGLARLVERQHGSTPVTEGHFNPRSSPNTFVRLDPRSCCLILTEADAQGTNEERVSVPRAHSEALLHACPARSVYGRIRLVISDTHEALIDRFTEPGELDLVSVEFDTREEAEHFVARMWFGLGDYRGFQFSRASIASDCPPPIPVELSNSALEQILDLLDREESAAVRTSAPADVLAKLSRAFGEQTAPSAASTNASGQAPITRTRARPAMVGASRAQ